jgi:hypothetical protein
MFTLDDFAVDHIGWGYAESLDGDTLYVLTQLADATIDITSESKEVRDKDGNLIKKIYTGKSGTLTANNALLNLSIIAAGSGSDKDLASSTNKISMPFVVEATTTDKTVTVEGVDSDSVSVVGMNGSGSVVKIYKTGTDADSVKVSGSTITLPTAADEVTQFLVKGTKSVQSGAKIVNYADKFPATIKLTLVAFVIDPCKPDTLKKVYIVLPSFQPSPDLSVNLTTDTQLEYTGDLQTAYCGSDGKVLFEIYAADDED